MELYNVSYVYTEHFIQWVEFLINHVSHCVEWVLCSDGEVKLLSARLLRPVDDIQLLYDLMTVNIDGRANHSTSTCVSFNRNHKVKATVHCFRSNIPVNQSMDSSLVFILGKQEVFFTIKGKEMKLQLCVEAPFASANCSGSSSVAGWLAGVPWSSLGSCAVFLQPTKAVFGRAYGP